LSNHADFQPDHSPLFMVMNDPVMHRLISYVAARKREQEANPDQHVRIELSRSLLTTVKESFRQRILKGELTLHLASEMLSACFLGEKVDLHSTVIGVLPGGENRPFLIRERITREMLFSQTDLDLGNHMVSKFRYQGPEGWSPLELAANFVEYLPVARTSARVNRITSRVKAEEELWNKVADELFGIDELIRRDKHLRQFSKYIKDVFGIKIVCEDEQSCLQVHRDLQSLTPRDVKGKTSRPEAGPAAAGGPLLEFIETKDYLTCAPSAMKKTGWKAMKNVVKWNNELLEIQIQPLDNYYLELDHMSGPSHNSFKLLRESFRQEVAARIPLYGFYRKLLRGIFQGGDVPCEFDNASVVVTE
jgi:hypothetical protein